MNAVVRAYARVWLALTFILLTSGAAFGIGYLMSGAAMPVWVRQFTAPEIIAVLLVGCLISLLAILVAVLELVEEAS